MGASHIIKTRVTAEVKQRVSEAAQRELLTESLWLRRLVDAALCAVPSASAPSERRPTCRRDILPALCTPSRSTSASGRTRLQIRLRHEDRLLLRERAAARGMPAATYLSALLRSHLRGLAPLPREELAAFKRSIAELSAIGRNLNQLARNSHQTGRTTGPGHQEVVSMLKVCEAMRSHVKAIVRSNVQSWESGYAPMDD